MTIHPVVMVSVRPGSTYPHQLGVIEDPTAEINPDDGSIRCIPNPGDSSFDELTEQWNCHSVVLDYSKLFMPNQWGFDPSWHDVLLGGRFGGTNTAGLTAISTDR